jgi:hypothetical protein
MGRSRIRPPIPGTSLTTPVGGRRIFDHGEIHPAHTVNLEQLDPNLLTFAENIPGGVYPLFGYAGNMAQSFFSR